MPEGLRLCRAPPLWKAAIALKCLYNMQGNIPAPRPCPPGVQLCAWENGFGISLPWRQGLA